MIGFAELVDDIDKMPFESQEILVDIINKRFSERKREKFIEETLNSQKDYKNGDFEEGNSEDLFKILGI